jgi:glutamine amidotransferase
MCRLLLVKADEEFDLLPHLEAFAGLCKHSKEYQGHGWGVAYLSKGKRHLHKSLTPVWEDDLSGFGSTRYLVAHARSAFQDKGIVVENNMPFVNDPYVFVFNGELRGVKINAEGRIGAEKVFNVIHRFYKGNMKEAVQRAVKFIEKRTGHIRALNFIVTDMKDAFVSSNFNSEPDYFTMHFKKQADRLIICSEPYPGETGWEKISNRSIEVFS